MNVTFLKLLLSHCIVIISLLFLGQPTLAFDHLLHKEMQKKKKKNFMQHLKIVFHISVITYASFAFKRTSILSGSSRGVFMLRNVLKSSLNPPPSKPGICSEPCPHAGLYVIINPCSALSTAPNYDQRRSRRSLRCAAQAMSEPGRVNWKKKTGWRRIISPFSSSTFTALHLTPLHLHVSEAFFNYLGTNPRSCFICHRKEGGERGDEEM